MKTQLTLYFVIGLLFITPSLVAQELLYLAAGEALVIKIIDPQTGKLSDFQRVELAGMSTFTFSRDKDFLYAQARINGDRKRPSIATYEVANDGRLTLVNNAQVSGKTTELKTDHSDKFIAGASYPKGIVSIWKLENGIYKGDLVQEVGLEKKVHAVRFSPDNKVLFIPATGPNKIFQLAFDQETGKVTEKEPALGGGEGASQPRHLVFHPTLNVAYSTQERIKPGVAVWQWSPNKGELQLTQTLTNSEDTTGQITNADLHISADQKFLYISSRDKKKQLDQIVVYKIDAIDGSLNLVKEFPTEHFPRSFALNISGDFIYVAGQRENKLGVYKIDKETGYLSKVIQYETGSNPTWLQTLEPNSVNRQSFDK